MNRLGGVILAWLLTATAAPGEDWRDHLPAEWLVVAETPRLDRLDALLTRLVTPWGRAAPRLQTTLDTLVPSGVLAERAWAVVVAESDAGAPTLVAYAPTDDYEALCHALDADRADDLALASLFGLDVVIQPLPGWARISLIDAAPNFARSADEPPAAPNDRSALQITFSPEGCRLVQQRLEEQRLRQLADRRRRYGPVRWPNDLRALISRLAPYAPVAAAIADWRAPLTVALSLRDEILQVEAAAAIRTPTPTPTQNNPAPALSRDRSILWLEAPGTPTERLVSLWMATQQSRPDRIEAPEYPQPQWDDFAAACQDFAASCRAAEIVMDLPAEQEPAAANQRVAIRWDPEARPLGDRLALAVQRWNAVQSAARARSPLDVELTPLDSVAGFRLRSDLIASAGLEPSPEIEAVFDRYYGAGRWLTAELTPQGEDGWIGTMRPGDSRITRAGAAEAESVALLRGELRVDRLTAWLTRLDRLMNEGAIGHRERPAVVAADPLRFVAEGGDRLSVTVQSPFATYEALAAYVVLTPSPDDD